MKKSWLLPAAAVIGGVAGLALRRLHLFYDFDAGTGLPLDPVRYGPALWGLTAAVLAVLLVLSLWKKARTFDKQFSSAFYARSPLWFILAAAGGVLFFAGGLLNLMDCFRPADLAGAAVRSSTSVLRLLLGVVSLLAGAGVCLTILAVRKKGEYRGGWFTLPGFACCLWVMACYQEWAKDPVLGHYLYPLLALLLSMLACYFISAFAFGKGRVTAVLFLASAAAALGVMSLADGGALYTVSLRLGAALYLLAMAGTLAENAARPAPPAVLPAGCAPADCAACPGCTPDGPAGAPQPENKP